MTRPLAELGGNLDMVFVCLGIHSHEAPLPVAFIILQLTSVMELGLAKVLG